ncbi:MAG: UvrD-helicase domain-containing protein [Granulosicoccus sp.]|nr:UvrD-helicase domain-containing protein [Granulosicoccus sp.]
MKEPLDASVRARALSPDHSFIVQAPAGSGKTELLTRRVLTLLCRVEQPEQILAITFTRKAASEMRQRVISMLQSAADNEVPGDLYEEQGLALAHAALERDRELGWQLLSHPQRLNLRTIDSLATQLAYCLPVSCALGAPVAVLEKADSLYLEVAARFIEANLAAMPRVLLQVGNKLERAQALLANLLANRDQWKRHVYGSVDDHDALRAQLENMLAELIESRLKHLCEKVPPELAALLLPRLHKAGQFLLQDNQSDKTKLQPYHQLWLDMHTLPGDSLSDLESWRSVASAILNNESKPRRQLNKNLGFPPEGDAKNRDCDKSDLKEHKAQMLNAIELAQQHPGFISALAEVRQLPEPLYQDDQWELLSELLSILPDLLVELQWVFADRRLVDFAEIAERAQRSLGTEDEPTDLALAMDLSLQHIMVDEFQDTSRTQFMLLRRLLDGWSEEDGRSFFAVGDPMQSIYRFRDADVSLFQYAQQHGIGPIQLEPLTLTANFRSAPALIDWTNTAFKQIFPAEADADTGAVPFSVSDPFREFSGEICIHPLIDTGGLQESTLVAELCAQAIKDDPGHQVAVLARTRNHVTAILAALREAKLSYHCVDMDPIGERAVVRDLIAWVLALRYPHDRLHWLAVLRSPAIGMTLKDLHHLMGHAEKHTSVIELLTRESVLATLSENGRARIERMLAVVQAAVRRASRQAIVPWVESVWLQLGGPAACVDSVDLDAVERALQVLSELEAQGSLWHLSTIEDAMKSLYATPAMDSQCQIQVMTLHKAKGLEFDTVILPALERKPMADRAQLLNWFEHTLDDKAQLLLAPLEQAVSNKNDRDPINRLVRSAKERCNDEEKNRLLYVACTRAKQNLHLIGTVSLDKQGEVRSPVRASLLEPLWPLLEPKFSAAAKGVANDTNQPSNEQLDLGIDSIQETTPVFKRLFVPANLPEFDVFGWHSPALTDNSVSEDIEYSWAGRRARDIGTVVHSHLQRLAGEPDSSDVVDRDVNNQATRRLVARQLKNLGFRTDQLDSAVDTVILALNNTLSDERGRWLLADHPESCSEWALSVCEANVSSSIPASAQTAQVRKIIIDRSFVDEHGIRWIVDYKTGEHRGGQVDTFLNREQERYAEQLNHYAHVVRKIDSRPIRVGLYFPMLKAWREWQPEHA